MRLNPKKIACYIKKINILLLIIMIFSMVTMRGVMNIASGILLLLSLIVFFLERGRNNKIEIEWILLISSYPLVIILNFFSPIGIQGSLNTLSRFYYVLIIIVYFINKIEYKDKKKLMIFFEIAMIIGCIWSLYLYNNPEQLNIHYPNNNNGIFRLRSFEAVGRWGIYLMMALIIKYSEIFIEKNKVKAIYNFCYLALLSCVLILNSGRGPWLFTLVGLSIFIIVSFNKKVILGSLIIGIIVIIPFKLNYRPSKYIERFISITNIDSNRSNTIRIETWKVGLDIANRNPFFGIGYHKNQKYVLEYREKMKEYMGKEYNNRYLYYSWVIEGAYVAFLAQIGYIYIIFYMGIIIFMLYKIFIKILNSNKEKRIELSGMFSAIIAYFLLQQFYLDLQNYSIYFVYLLLFLCTREDSTERV